MKMMIPRPYSFNIAVVTTFPIGLVVSFCFTEMHLRLILVLVDEMVTAPFVLDI